MEDDAPNVVRAVIAAAMNGDMTAARLVLDRILPVRRGRPVTLQLPELRTPTDLVMALNGIARAVAAGLLTPEEGQAVAAILEQQRRAIETTELESRIAVLEGKTA
jgi:hypothetical protein